MEDDMEEAAADAAGASGMVDNDPKSMIMMSRGNARSILTPPMDRHTEESRTTSGANSSTSQQSYHTIVSAHDDVPSMLSPVEEGDQIKRVTIDEGTCEANELLDAASGKTPQSNIMVEQEETEPEEAEA